MIPEWAAAQEEYLALRRAGDAALLDAARQRLRLAGMPASTISRLERSGKIDATISVIAPLAGVLQELEVREGMTLAAGAPLARINGLDSVWLAVAVPEAQSAGIQVGQQAAARLPALPGQVIEGEVSAVLPEASAASRTVRVRVQLPNPEGRLRPGLTAQVALAGSETAAVLLVPSEAVIRTGRRALVMLAEAGGRYRPVEVETGRERQPHGDPARPGGRPAGGRLRAVPARFRSQPARYRCGAGRRCCRARPRARCCPAGARAA